MILTDGYRIFVFETLSDAYNTEPNEELIGIIGGILDDTTYSTVYKYSKLCSVFNRIESKCKSPKARDLVMSVHDSMHESVAIASRLN